MTTVSTMAKGASWTLISSILVKFSGWIYYIILARLVSAEQIGMFYLVLSIISIVMIFSNLGLGSGAIARYLPYYVGKRYFNYVREVMSISATAGTIFSIICIIPVILFAGNISNFLHNENLTPIFYVMASYLLINNMYTLVENFLRGRKLIKLCSYITTIQGFGKLIFTVIILLFAGFNAIGIAFGFVLSFLFAATIGLYWVIREYRSLPRSGEIPEKVKLFKEMVTFGLTAVAIGSVWMIMTYTDRIMLGYFLPVDRSMESIGIYSIVIGFSAVIIIFVGAISGIYYPMIAEFYGRGETEEIKKITTTATRWIAITSCPLLLMILVFPKQILGVIYGPFYVTGYFTLMVYACGTFIFSFSYPSTYILDAIRRLDITAKITLLGAFLNVILNFILIPEYGIEGAAIASASTYLVLTTLLIISSNRLIRIGFPDISRIIISSIITIILLFILKPHVVDLSTTLGNTVFESSTIIQKFLKLFMLGVFLTITTLIYLISLILFKVFEKEDVDMIKGAMRRLNVPEGGIAFMGKILQRDQ